jgi:N-sulfoglucosamine sulfohydrolase
MTDKPNIILITCHDIGRHLGCYGVETVNTPCIDKFASQSVLFKNSFCTAPQCSPSRASIYTGRYPHNNGVMGLTHFNFAWDLKPGEKHLNNYLKDAGYQTALIGIQHETRHPENIGFDYLKTPNVDASSGKFGSESRYDGNPTCEMVADDATAYLKNHTGGGEPFYLQVGFFEPHRKFEFGEAKPDTSKGVSVPPYLVDDESAREEFAAFQGAIRKVDAAIGRIFDAVDENAVADNTIVIYTADHGIPFPKAKCTLYDAGLEVPLIIRRGKTDPRGGTTLTEMISNIDYLPTLLDIIGLDTPECVQGKSFAGLLEGGDYQQREEIFGELTYHDYYNPMRCIRTQRDKLIANFSTAPAIMNPSQSYLPVCITRVPEDPAYAYHEHLQLYDLENDPCEQKDLAGDEQYADIKNRLASRLLDWMKETNDPLLDGAVACPHHYDTMAKLKDAKKT